MFETKTEEKKDWDQFNYEKGKIGQFYEGTYTNREGQLQPFAVVTIGEEMVESLLRDMKAHVEGKLSLFLNEKIDKEGKTRKVLSFKIDEKFKKSISKD